MAPEVLRFAFLGDLGASGWAGAGGCLRLGDHGLARPGVPGVSGRPVTPHGVTWALCTRQPAPGCWWCGGVPALGAHTGWRCAYLSQQSATARRRRNLRAASLEVSRCAPGGFQWKCIQPPYVTVRAYLELLGSVSKNERCLDTRWIHLAVIHRLYVS
jgi:hypothetical protein